MIDQEQSTIIRRIQILCNELKHSEAIELTNQINNSNIALRAHLLCIEHEERCRQDGRLAQF